MIAKSEFQLQFEGYGLTTAHILYRIPDFETVLQTYVWQDYDLAPEFPQMRRFLDYWAASLDGRLHSVRYSHHLLIGPGEWRKVDGSGDCSEEQALPVFGDCNWHHFVSVPSPWTGKTG
jgi:uncharacterized protein Usg